MCIYLMGFEIQVIRVAINFTIYVTGILILHKRNISLRKLWEEF